MHETSWFSDGYQDHHQAANFSSMYQFAEPHERQELIEESATVTVQHLDSKSS
jgi:hypothetical protein